MFKVSRQILITLYFRYSYSINYQPIDAYGYCAHEYIKSYETYWKHYGNLPFFIRMYEEVMYGRNSSHIEHCIKNTKLNVAIVNFQIASSANDLINQIIKTPRVTTADILSNIGKFTITILLFFNFILPNI